ncbi:phenylacetate-CoA oxygenase subunit PaaJ [Brevibacterium sp. p3-SID960]|nr:1,2-phenylacetyl-CoA epoxidase subunit PaaD [Brevibacterium sp. p3-SID960]MCT1690343.1 phenylacetate-CoA oxygenase subunit PaaJ [Brevibacterium sp. p3-SID960]
MTEPAETAEAIVRAVRAVCDPEIPVLTIEDLGILRSVEVEAAAEADETGEAEGPGEGEATGEGKATGETAGLRAHVVITPTYSGCPAMETIRADVQRAARAAGAAEVDVELVFSPAWTTDWMSDEGKAKLSEYGIAPPAGRAAGPIGLSMAVKCPLCHSLNTTGLSRFGSTACKALYRCSDCLEPFDYFKVH